MNKSIVMAWVVSFAITPTALAADSFDGSEPLLCALLDINECAAGNGCEEVMAESINAPRFLRVNVKDKQITGKRASGSENTAAIEFMERLDGKLILQGADDGVEGVRDGLGWTLTIAEDTGKLVLTASGDDVAFIAFGACTPL